jgi:hypothetical protein
VLLQHLSCNDSERVGQLTVVAFAPGLHVSDAVRAFTATDPDVEIELQCGAVAVAGAAQSRFCAGRHRSRPAGQIGLGETVVARSATSKDLVLVAWPRQWSQDI